MAPRVHIIAEAGNNHNGKLELAQRLVDVAVEAGADSIKFQLIYPEGLYLPQLFQERQYVDNPVLHKRRASMLSDEEYHVLAAYCQAKGVPFSASVFDWRGIQLLDELDVPYIKIASCDLNNSRLLTAAAEPGRPLVISTGMASLGEIEQAVSDVVATGNTKIVLMHCVSVYPCSTARMNLSFVATLKQAFGFPVGLSDHTEDSLAAAMAISLGVAWIEKHFTLDRRMDGFDHAYAMEPAGLIHFVRDMRAATEACTRPCVKVQTEEIEIKSRARRGLYAARDIHACEVLKEEDILTVRPPGTLSPNDLYLILGRPAKRMIHHYEPLSLDQF